MVFHARFLYSCIVAFSSCSAIRFRPRLNRRLCGHGRRTNRSSPDRSHCSTAPIQDNSFLVEEAYNQEDGVIQHISFVAPSQHRRLGVHPDRRVAPALVEAPTQPHAGFQPLCRLHSIRSGMGRHCYQLSLSTGGKRRDTSRGRSAAFSIGADGRQHRGPRRRGMGLCKQTCRSAFSTIATW